MSPAVDIVDVAPRDGLQNAATVLPPSARTELVRRLLGAGVARVEAVSFVRPDRVPAMAGAEEVVAGLAPAEAARCAGLVLNSRGYDRLVAAGMRDVRFTLAASDEFNRRNSGAPTADSLAAARDVLARARADGLRAGVVLATAFGCPFTGEVDAGRVAELAAELAAAGADEVLFADTIGVAVPRQVRTVLRDAAALDATLGVHLHNTRNTGYVNAFAALEAGASVLDASLGGLGGCPFAPNATGNVATEDLVYLLEREGVATGIDLDRLIGASHWLAAETGLPLDGQVQAVDPFPPRRAAAPGETAP